ncbi:MAG: (Fe-S)-binding protein [Sphingobacteriales bacterium]|nr:(Fe-S)-binding protein [Sphingobacteriales bacterium]
MLKQIIFITTLLLTLGIFAYTVRRYYLFFRLTKPFPVKNWKKRIGVMFKVAFFQSKIFRFPLTGLFHALTFWGFCALLFVVFEMVLDGIAGTDKALAGIGWFYNVLTATGDISAFIVFFLIIIFLFRRNYLNIKRFQGIEMTQRHHNDAHLALTLIMLVVFTLLAMNTYYINICKFKGEEVLGTYPVSSVFALFWTSDNYQIMSLVYNGMWWVHILTIFAFANILPYSKHFHVFLSIPNVLLSRLEPLGYLEPDRNITREVRYMLNPDAADVSAENQAVERFGVKDVQDVTWKNYLDSLTCTQCGRCTSVCPANITGKLLSPRKIIMNLRERMNEIGPKLVKNGKDFSDNKSLLRDYVSEEELWACTTCNACAQECPVNINHPSLIVDMRRFLVMEEGKAPSGLNAIFANIENNGAPWQYSSSDRLKWYDDWTEKENYRLPLVQELAASGKTPEYLFWVGSAGAFDDRYKKVSRAFVKILNHLNIDFAVLGTEETDTADSARRAGNEMLYQMQTLMIIELLNNYGIKKIITCCPHDFNTFKNEYPGFGGHFQVEHHTQFISRMINEGRLQTGDTFSGTKITYHDPCYLGRANGEYHAPRFVLTHLKAEVEEMKRNRSFALCCGAGGGQMFKEAEKGNKEVYAERTEEALKTGASIVATACPFCMVMLTDGLKYKNMEEEVRNYDIAELVAMAI